MNSKKRLWIPLAVVPVFAALLATPTASWAATHKTHHVACELTKDGQTETQRVASAKECTAIGGKVAAKKHAARKHK